MKTLVVISRILVGALFIFSGIIKANDPLGFSYKMEEYFYEFGMDWMTSFSDIFAILICILEVIVGVALLVGSKMRIVAPLVLFMIIFFTWLTGYSAITGNVTDCGCFGDAIKLTPKESFIKDLILLGFILIIFVKRKAIIAIPNVATSNVVMLIGLAMTSMFTLWSYTHLPVKDFRPYKIGINIAESMVLGPDAIQPVYENIFIYKNKQTGEEKEFVNEVPTDYDNWEFVDRKDRTIVEGDVPPIHDFSISDDDGNDLTDQLLNDPQYTLWVIAYDLKKAELDGFEGINNLAADSQANGMGMLALTATTDIEKFRHEVGAAYPFYLTDGTALKTIIRSNPGLLLVRQGTIFGKWHHNDLPSFSEIEQDFLSN